MNRWTTARRSLGRSTSPTSCCGPRRARSPERSAAGRSASGDSSPTPPGRDLVRRLTDEVLRLDRPAAAARRFSALAGAGVPRSLGSGDRLLMAAGARLAPLAPTVVMPLVRRRIIAETRGLVIPADDAALTRHIRRRTAAGVRLNLNLLGEAILSDDEAEQRIARVIDTLRRPDVSYISVKISAICALLDVYAFDHSVERISAALRRIYDAARRTTPPAFVNLDMEEYGDLALTVEAFVRVLDEPAYRQMPAGIVLQAYLPDSHNVMERLGDWAAQRVARRRGADQGAHREGRQPGDGAGRRRAARLGPGAVPVEGRHRRQLQAPARLVPASGVGRGGPPRRRQPQPLRPGMGVDAARRSAGVAARRHRASTSRCSRGWSRRRPEPSSSAPGRCCLYCPIVRTDEIEASLAYLARRFDENTSPENFLRAMFSMRSGSPEFAAEAERFRGPSPIDTRCPIERRRRPVEVPARTDIDGAVFVNHPDTDFTDAGPAGRRGRRPCQARREWLPGRGVPADDRHLVDRRRRCHRRGGAADVGGPAARRAGTLAAGSRRPDGGRALDDAGADGGRGGKDGPRRRPGGLRGDRLRPLLQHRRHPCRRRAVRRGRRRLAVELSRTPFPPAACSPR